MKKSIQKPTKSTCNKHAKDVIQRAHDALVELTQLAHYNQAGAEALFDHVCAACDKLGYILLDRRELLGRKLGKQTFIPTIRAKDPNALTIGLNYLAAAADNVVFRGAPPDDTEWRDDGLTLEYVFNHFLRCFANGVKPDPRNKFEPLQGRTAQVNSEMKTRLLAKMDNAEDWAHAFMEWLEEKHPSLVEKPENVNWRTVDWSVTQWFPRGVIWLYGEQLTSNQGSPNRTSNPLVRVREHARDRLRTLLKRYKV